MLQAKIHRATVIKADLNYIGSITIDKKLIIMPPKSFMSMKTIISSKS